jgi:hypothetical protein
MQAATLGVYDELLPGVAAWGCGRRGVTP